MTTYTCSRCGENVGQLGNDGLPREGQHVCADRLGSAITIEEDTEVFPDTDPRSNLVASAEASTLGLRPGQWPSAIIYEGVVYDRPRFVYFADDIGYANYTSGPGRFQVYND